MDKKKNHIKSIKEKLNYSFHNNKENMNTLHSRLVDMGYEFSYETISLTLNMHKDTLNTMVIVALCKYWDLDLNYVLKDPDEDEIVNKVYSFVEDESNKFMPLTDKLYAGSYTCYFLNYYSSKFPQKSALQKGTLEINVDETGASAVFSIEFDNKVDAKNVFRGVPYISSFSNNIVLFLHDEVGKFYFLTMHYKKYHSKEMMFRIGSMQTVYKQSVCMPLSQKFVLFRNDIKPENEKFILGLLDMDIEKIMIRNKDLELLFMKEPVVMKFCREFEKLIKNSSHEVHIFTKQQVFDEFDIEMDTEDILKALLLIKNSSISPKLMKLTDDFNIYNLSKKL